MPDPDDHTTDSLPLGAIPGDGTRCRFTVWAPESDKVEVDLPGGRHPLQPAENGLHSAVLEAQAGQNYWFRIDGGEQLPDPCSRCQPQGLSGPSRILDVEAIRATAHATPFTPPALDDLFVYELHVGTFSKEGTFAGVIPQLERLKRLGVTALELMPVATFPGRHGWGYDGVLTYATQFSYGGPSGLAELVDAAHGHGLAVILDVVYNHLGAGSDKVTAFGPYFTDKYDTPWGRAFDYAQTPVREWAIQNAESWIRDFNLDGLRLDATHAIFDERDPHVLRELNDRVKLIKPGALIISEMEIGDERPITAWGHDAQWEDALHHAVHVLLTGEHESYYAPYGRIADLVKQFTRPERRRFVVCDQNHDQVGNRALGDRLRGQDLRLAAFCSILSPGTPMLFQGEEYDESHPFQYFTDHTDPRIAQLTRDGRRSEFAAFTSFTHEEIPDPQDPRTFERSRLNPADGDSEHEAYYRWLIETRRAIGEAPAEVLRADEDSRFLVVRRGDHELRMNFSESEQDGVPPRSGAVVTELQED